MSSAAYSLDIISASYAHLDVTTQLRDKYREASSEHPHSKVFTFIPSNAFFGTDPLPNVLKACVVVWRVLLPNQGNDTTSKLYSPFQASVLLTCFSPFTHTVLDLVGN